jgi:MOSC domain-containing protein YiiM
MPEVLGMANDMGEVVAIAVRTAVKGPMRAVRQAVATTNGGLEGDIEVSPNRGITFIDKRQWDEVTRELNADLPWHTRRANVLVEGLTLADVIGKRIRIGFVEAMIIAETKPCGLMDELYLGLRQALVPDCRGGVYGRVTHGGAFRVGDKVTVVPPGHAQHSEPPT